MNDTSGKIGFGALTAIVFGMMVGAGIYNLPQNMAVSAGPVAVIISWVITAVGMLLLVGTFKILSDHRPDLNAGIYQYAHRSFGHFAGFNVAWGYWLATSFANIAYAVMLNDSFGAFIPPLLQHSWPTLLFGTILIWGMYFIVAAGIQAASLLNNILSVLKVLCLLLVVTLFIIGIRADIFSFNWADLHVDGTGLGTQVKSTMMVTLWCFIGIEGAVMLASRAKRPSDVGKATVTGFIISWSLYIMVSVLCFGAMSRAQLAGLNNPSVAYALRYIFGDWAYWCVIISVIIALLGGWVAWTLVCAQLPHEAAKCNVFPKIFLRVNKHGIPTWGLLLSSIVMQGFMMLVLLSNDAYLMTLNITGVMFLPAYLTSGIYLWRESVTCRDLHPKSAGQRRRYMAVGIGCTLYCIWLLYAGGLDLLVFTVWFYLAGAGMYLKARSQQKSSERVPYTRSDLLTLIVLLAAAALSIVLICTGHTPF